MVDPASVTQFTFNNGQKIPAVGLGTWQAPPDGSLYRAVREAIRVGYRHLDCAHIYQNEEEVGRAIADSIKAGEVTREQLFITSKIWPTYYRKDRVPINAQKILKALGVSYLDLLLVHWPMSFKQQDETLFPAENGKMIDGGIDYLEVYHALEDLQDQGIAKSIGISNFTVDQVKRTLAEARIKPVTNQIELHPYLVQRELQDLCKKNGILLTAYSPLGNPGSVDNLGPNKERLLKDEVVNRIAQKYGKNAGQILIKYQVASGNVVVPKSVSPERLKANISVFDFELTPEEIKELDGLDRNYRSNLFLTPDTRGTTNYPFK